MQLLLSGLDEVNQDLQKIKNLQRNVYKQQTFMMKFIRGRVNYFPYILFTLFFFLVFNFVELFAITISYMNQRSICWRISISSSVWIVSSLPLHSNPTCSCSVDINFLPDISDVSFQKEENGRRVMDGLNFKAIAWGGRFQVI